MADKLDQYTDVLQRLVRETVACTPQEWTSGSLHIESDGTRINYKLKNTEQPSVAQISEKLRDLIDELYVRMAHHGEAWTEATISFTQAGKELKFDTKFKYPDRNPSGAPAATKPKWKFW